jgi:SDR family mycofactocin-dependent oxidoreductase
VSAAGAPVALLTGAARGIGAATARRLADDGWDLVLLDGGAGSLPGYHAAGPDEVETVAAACRAQGAVVQVVIGDVRSDADVRSAVEHAGRLDGPLTAAVAAAGFVTGGPAGWETPPAVWEATFDVVLGGVRRLAEAAVPVLLEHPLRGRARFVAVSSAGGAAGLPRLAAYSSAKHAVNGLVRSLAAELGPLGVTANAVAPGSTRTAALEASAAVYGLDDPEEFAAQSRLGRLLEPEEIAAAIAWLCGPDSGGLTGAIVPVDAGMTA